ncbi:unnamed protein product [Brassicogethes aeneus]|uniref:Uncharacterized protein n=1 Tax=Brassicogethes aeneus TaxID=1431903 RepID=A0A9P0BBJ8_BRAAE|nr:unnamed protein product [Brassicogethes aeneus]
MASSNNKEQFQAVLNDLRNAVKTRIDADEEDIQNFLSYFNGQEQMITETTAMTINAKFSQYQSMLQFLERRAHDFSIQAENCLGPAKEKLTNERGRVIAKIKEKLGHEVRMVRQLYQGYQTKSNAILVDIQNEIATIEEKLNELDAQYISEAMPAIGQKINNLPTEMLNEYEDIKNQVQQKGEKLANFIEDAIIEVETIGSIVEADAKKCVYTLIQEHQTNKANA